MVFRTGTYGGRVLCASHDGDVCPRPFQRYPRHAHLRPGQPRRDFRRVHDRSCWNLVREKRHAMPTLKARTFATSRNIRRLLSGKADRTGRRGRSGSYRQVDDSGYNPHGAAASGEWSMYSLLLSHGLNCYQRQRIIERNIRKASHT